MRYGRKCANGELVVKAVALARDVAEIADEQAAEFEHKDRA